MAEVEQAIGATGVDVEAAIEAGLTRLGVAREAVEIEVLDKGSQGVFGLGSREASVRLTVKSRPASVAADESAPPGRAVAPLAVEPPVAEQDHEAQIAEGALLELLALMGVEKVQIDVRRDEPAEGEEEAPLVLNVRGLDSDVLIGYRGKTLAALQRITRLIVGRELADRTWLVVDVEGFKVRREKSLRSLALRMAEQVERTDRTVMLEPMPPNERRIVHMALRDHPHVTTQSIGEGDRRKVTIFPRY